MRRQLRTIYSLIVVATLLSACASPTVIETDTHERDIRALVDRFVAAVNAADADAFVQCFAEDATAFFPSNANAMRRSGREAIRAAVTPAFARGKPATVVVQAS